MKVNSYVKNNDNITFVIFDRVKHSRRVQKPKEVICVSCDIPSVNVMDYVKAYIDRAKPFRVKLRRERHEQADQLFLSWFNKTPVTCHTLARWLKMALSQAGINTYQFSPHSFRGAGLSAALRRGASITEIEASGCWTNTENFNRHYFAPEWTSSVGQIILNCL